MPMVQHVLSSADQRTVLLRQPGRLGHHSQRHALQLRQDFPPKDLRIRLAVMLCFLRRLILHVLAVLASPFRFGLASLGGSPARLPQFRHPRPSGHAERGGMDLLVAW